ncbi:rhamnogalacturonan acetylesterase [Virgibacillus sp. LDC1]|uniref:rhamnogalacturonan acetylesterase n=1 Tax=Paenibacillus sp. GM2FR TaxID=2059268 RepID=UPI000C26EC67|nr:rhamnogalacturonan acetylesterase [Paenibacillus sp. GM2FR]MCV4232303.1 rhamnogalacturonan acetylesterase [Virgibacillus sp. LDC1]PJN56289.1 Rhamnogalacturonan acetylesterase RhgT [Paenibacillus sp. GM2FR]
MQCRYKFDFGTEAPGHEHTKITAETLYSPELGFGFHSLSHLSAVNRAGEKALMRDFVIPLHAAFQVDVIDGLYTLHLLIGDAWFDTETSIRGTEGQMLLDGKRIPAGHFERFSVTVPAVQGKIVLTFSGRAPRINALEVAPAPHACHVFLAGDSTVTNQPADGYPYAGWGQMLPAYIKADAAVSNYARSGRSSKSFITEGILEQISEKMKPHDYMLIQFGHNDQKRDEERYTEPFSTYKDSLKKYVDVCREKQATPILVTPVHRRYFDSKGLLEDTHGDYIMAVRELADEERIPLIDLAALSLEYFNQLGPEGTKSVFMWGRPGEFLLFPQGVTDNTHFQERGAARLADMVARRLKALGLQPLSLFLR